MLDLKFIRENVDLVKKALADRNLKIDLDGFVRIIDQRKKVLLELEELRAQKNKANDEISALLKEKKDAQAKIASMKAIAQNIDDLEAQLKELDPQIDKIILTIPNIPHESLPIGDASQNKVVRSWGECKKLDFKPLTHIELAQNLDIVDFNRATKITGSNWILYKGWGAKLERALINFMLDLHTRKHGYTEIFPPFMANPASLMGTGQLPKLKDDMFEVQPKGFYLIPTA